jgi:hypothetical protein
MEKLMANQSALENISSWSEFQKTIYAAAPKYDLVPAKLAELKQAAARVKSLYPEPDGLLTRGALKLEDLRKLFESGAVAKRAEEMNAWHVEELLNQASLHLDRTFQLRERIDALKVNAFQSLMDLWEFSELDEVHDEEITEGRYALDNARLEAEVKASQATIASLEQELGATDSFLRPYAATTEIKSDWWKETTYGTKITERAVELANLAGAAASPTDAAWNANSQIGKGKQVREIGQPVFEFEARYQMSYALAQHYSVYGANDSAKALLNGQTKQLNYYGKSEGFQIRRVNVQRKLMQRRFFELYSDGGALCFFGQIEELSKLLDAEILEALSAMLASSNGLRRVFKYPGALDETDFKNNDLTMDIVWVREAISWLRRLLAKDNTVVLPLSLKSLSKPDLDQDGSVATWKFTVGHESANAFLKTFIADYDLLRIKGLAAFVDSPTKEKTWSMRIRPPQASVNDSSKTKPIFIGRVGVRESNQNPIVCGMDVALNTSPMGVWEVSLFLPPAPTKAQNEKLVGQIAAIDLEVVVSGLAKAGT